MEALCLIVLYLGTFLLLLALPRFPATSEHHPPSPLGPQSAFGRFPGGAHVWSPAVTGPHWALAAADSLAQSSSEAAAGLMGKRLTLRLPSAHLVENLLEMGTLLILTLVLVHW